MMLFPGKYSLQQYSVRMQQLCGKWYHKNDNVYTVNHPKQMAWKAISAANTNGLYFWPQYLEQNMSRL